MKIIRTYFSICTIISMVFLMASLNSCSSKYVQMDETTVDASLKSVAEEIGHGLLSDYKEGNFKELNADNATPEMQKAFTVQRQQKAYKYLQKKYGEYESMQYVGTWEKMGESRFLIYRFKGTFSNSYKTPEIRVVLDKEGKLAGFWLKPWMDKVL